MKYYSKKMPLVCALLLLVAFIPAAAFSGDAPGGWETKYKDEPYLRILDEMTVRVNKDFSYTTTWHLKDKIQNEAGKARGEVRLYYDQKREEIQAVEAYTVRPDGTRIKCDSIQDQNDPNGYGIYTDNRRKIITAPEAVIGNTVDVKITSLHKIPVIEGNFFDHFRFSCTCPIKESRYRLIVPEGMKINTRMLNSGLKPLIERNGGDVVYTWETFDNDKDETEENMPSGEEVYPEVVVSTLDDWSRLSSWYYDLHKKNLKTSPEIKAKVSEITAGKATIQEKIQTIIDYMRNEFRYVSMNIENHGYEPHPSDEIFQHKYGDCKDQTLLAIAMLREIGISARPALVSTWAELKREDLLPIPSYFDHVILSFDYNGATYYTDVLQKGYDFTELPASLSEKKVLTVKEKNGGFVILPKSDIVEMSGLENTNVAISEDGKAVVDAQYIFPRSVSILMREGIKNMPKDIKEKFFAAMEAQMLSGGKLINSSWQNLDDPHKQLVFSIKFENPTLVQHMGDFMMFGLKQVPRGVQFVSPKRKLPIVFKSSFLSDEKITYSIPKGFEVVSIPKKVSLQSEIIGLEREYKVAGNQIKARQTTSYRRGRMPAAEYPQLQKFLNDMPLLTNDKIVIKKKDDVAATKISAVK